MFKKYRITFLFLLSLLGVTLACSENSIITEELESAIIIGSTEHPDPVLKIVRDLEKKGILKNVMVMESFPVQIKVTGPKSIIQELHEIPRKVSPSFK